MKRTKILTTDSGLKRGQYMGNVPLSLAVCGTWETMRIVTCEDC